MSVANVVMMDFESEEALLEFQTNYDKNVSSSFTVFRPLAICVCRRSLSTFLPRNRFEKFIYFCTNISRFLNPISTSNCFGQNNDESRMLT